MLVSCHAAIVPLAATRRGRSATRGETAVTVRAGFAAVAAFSSAVQDTSANDANRPQETRARPWRGEWIFIVVTATRAIGVTRIVVESGRPMPSGKAGLDVRAGIEQGVERKLAK